MTTGVDCVAPPTRCTKTPSPTWLQLPGTVGPPEVQAPVKPSQGEGGEVHGPSKPTPQPPDGVVGGGSLVHSMKPPWHGEGSVMTTGPGGPWKILMAGAPP